MKIEDFVAIPCDIETLLKTMEISCNECYRTVITSNALRFMDLENTYKFMEIKFPKRKWGGFNFFRNSKEKARLIKKNTTWKKVEDIKMIISHLSQGSIIKSKGIFRVNGNCINSKMIVEYMKIANGDLTGLSDSYSVFDYASALKKMITIMEPKIIPDEFRNKLFSITKNICHEDKVTCISLLIRLLPDYLRAITFDIFSFLKKLSLENQIMTPIVIAKLFAPCLTDVTILNVKEIIPIIGFIVDNGDRLRTLPEAVVYELKRAYISWVKSEGKDIEYVYRSFALPLEAEKSPQNVLSLRPVENIMEEEDPLDDMQKNYLSDSSSSCETECGNGMSFDSDKENNLTLV